MKKNFVFISLILVLCFALGLAFSNVQINSCSLQVQENIVENQTIIKNQNEKTNNIQTENKNTNDTTTENTKENEKTNTITSSDENENINNKTNFNSSNKTQTEKTTNNENTSLNNKNKTQKDNTAKNETKNNLIDNSINNNTTNKKENNNVITTPDKNTTNSTENSNNTLKKSTENTINKNATNNNTTKKNTFAETNIETNKETGLLNESESNSTNTNSDKKCPCKVIVCGIGNSCLKPDKATIKFSVITQGETTDGLDKTNTDSVNNIISKLEALNISKKDIKNLNYNMFKRYDYKDGEQVFLGYEISNTLEVKTNNLDNITTLISTLNENGISEIYSINLGVEDETTAYNQALKNALENAKAKAQILCENNEIKVCKIIELKENNMVNLARFDAKMLNETNFDEIMQNEICVNANIIVEFCY